MLTGWQEQSAAEYHADALSDGPSLSPSCGWTLVNRSPLHAHHEHPRLGANRRKATDAMDDGTIVHAFVLGRGGERVEKITAVYGPKHERAGELVSDYRTDAAKADRDAILGRGNTPLLAAESLKLGALATAFEQRLAADGVVLLPEHSERALYWVETADDGTKVQCRTLFDNWNHETATDTDLKTCDSAHPKSCVRHVEAYGAHVQFAAHLSALRIVHPELIGRVSQRWVFAEMEPPHPILVVGPSSSMEELGELLWRQAVNRWARCLNTGKWPGYESGPLEASRWALEGAYIMEGA